MKNKQEEDAALIEESRAPRFGVEELDRSRAEYASGRKELPESEKRYRVLFERAGDAIFILDAEPEESGQIVSANQAAAKMHGYAIGELPGLKIEALYTPDAVRGAADLMRRIMEKEWVRAETTHRKKDGTVLLVETSAGLLELGGHKYILVFDKDITELRRAEEELRKYHDHLNELVKLSELVRQRTRELTAANEHLQKEISSRKRTEQALQKAREELEKRVEERTAELSKANRLLKLEIAERKEAEEALQKRTYDLGERVKELSCLYEVAQLTAETDASLGKAFQNTVNLLPPAWQYPNITCARITFEGQEFKTENFAETFWRQFAEIIVDREKVGVVEVAYLEEKPEIDEGPFLKEERSLIDALARLLGDFVKHKWAEQQLQVYQRQLRSLASEASLAEERERRRIATELHDTIGQTLAFAKIKMGGLQASLSPPAGRELTAVRELINQVIRDTRSLTFEVSPPVLHELGIESAMEWLAEHVEKEHGIRIKLSNDRQPKPLEDDISVLLFQTVRELLVNVVKHAQAQETEISIGRENNSIRIVVQDDGIGFSSDKVYSRMGKTEGYGLFSIRERLIHLGGHFEIKSTPNHGTRATVIAPLKCDRETHGRN